MSIFSNKIVCMNSPIKKKWHIYIFFVNIFLQEILENIVVLTINLKIQFNILFNSKYLFIWKYSKLVKDQ